MLLWVLLALMTGAAVLAVLWPLSKPSDDAEASGGEVDFYRAQLAEIERDEARGLIGVAERDAARIELGRRLLRAASAPGFLSDATSEPALRRRRAASALALCIVPIVGLGLYGGYGSPELQGDRPVTVASAGTTEPAEGQLRLEDALKRVENHLSANPADSRGWDVVAPIYLRAGRYGDALGAYAKARSSGGDTVTRLLGEAEARIGLARGQISGETRQLLETALVREPHSVPARYYLALGREQSGDRQGAREAYRALLLEASTDAPWVPLLQTRLSRLGGGGVPQQQASAVPTIPAVAVTPEISAMVGGLDERLREQGGSEDEWSRLVRSLVVLGRRDDANDRLARAKAALSADPEAPARLDRLAGDLGLAQRPGR